MKAPSSPLKKSTRGRRSRSEDEARPGLFWGWAPLVLALGFLGQITAFGYGPARAKAQRLDRDEHEMTQRIDVLLAEEGLLMKEGRMLDDDIYRERVRRTLRDPRQETLTLARAQARGEEDR